MAIPFQRLKALAHQKRAEYGIVTSTLGLQVVRKIYKAECITLDYRKFPSKIRAVYMCDDNDPSVAVSKTLPDIPKLFSLVHELKHHYEDRPVLEAGNFKCGDYNENQEIEIGAEVFAAEFIYPECEFLAYAKTLNITPANITAESIVHFKRGCGARVSYTFIRKSFVRLGFISKGAFQSVQFTRLEERLYGLPIFKEEWFKARRAGRKAA